MFTKLHIISIFVLLSFYPLPLQSKAAYQGKVTKRFLQEEVPKSLQPQSGAGRGKPEAFLRRIRERREAQERLEAEQRRQQYLEDHDSPVHIEEQDKESGERDVFIPSEDSTRREKPRQGYHVDPPASVVALTNHSSLSSNAFSHLPAIHSKVEGYMLRPRKQRKRFLPDSSQSPASAKTHSSWSYGEPAPPTDQGRFAPRQARQLQSSPSLSSSLERFDGDDDFYGTEDDSEHTKKASSRKLSALFMTKPASASTSANAHYTRSRNNGASIALGKRPRNCSETTAHLSHPSTKRNPFTFQHVLAMPDHISNDLYDGLARKSMNEEERRLLASAKTADDLINAAWLINGQFRLKHVQAEILRSAGRFEEFKKIKHGRVTNPDIKRQLKMEARRQKYEAHDAYNVPEAYKTLTKVPLQIYRETMKELVEQIEAIESGRMNLDLERSKRQRLVDKWTQADTDWWKGFVAFRATVHPVPKLAQLVARIDDFFARGMGRQKAPLHRSNRPCLRKFRPTE